MVLKEKTFLGHLYYQHFYMLNSAIGDFSSNVYNLFSNFSNVQIYMYKQRKYIMDNFQINNKYDESIYLQLEKVRYQSMISSK